MRDEGDAHSGLGLHATIPANHAAGTNGISSPPQKTAAGPDEPLSRVAASSFACR